MEIAEVLAFRPLKWLLEENRECLLSTENHSWKILSRDPRCPVPVLDFTWILVYPLRSFLCVGRLQAIEPTDYLPSQSLQILGSLRRFSFVSIFLSCALCKSREHLIGALSSHWLSKDEALSPHPTHPASQTTGTPRRLRSPELFQRTPFMRRLGESSHSNAFGDPAYCMPSCVQGSWVFVRSKCSTSKLNHVVPIYLTTILFPPPRNTHQHLKEPVLEHSSLPQFSRGKFN